MPCVSDQVTGHTDYLTEDQISLMTFKRLVKQREHVFDADDPLGEATLLQFLKEEANEIYSSIRVNDMQDARRFFPKLVGTTNKSSEANLVFRFVVPVYNDLRSQAIQPPISSIMTVVDLEGMKLLDWRLMLPHLQEFIDLLKHYPSVNHDTRNPGKVNLLGRDFQSSLLEFIDSSSLPQFLGGELKWEIQDRSVIDAASLIGEWRKGSNYSPPPSNTATRDPVARCRTLIHRFCLFHYFVSNYVLATGGMAFPTDPKIISAGAGRPHAPDERGAHGSAMQMSRGLVHACQWRMRSGDARGGGAGVAGQMAAAARHSGAPVVRIQVEEPAASHADEVV
ncbi:hypothetical protein B0H13DRAFT_1870372 [Mycena leptocephala]|nr:hypothetical protein B0H13DRAFT_1870372 [Mycena leptocephala]